MGHVPHFSGVFFYLRVVHGSYWRIFAWPIGDRYYTFVSTSCRTIFAAYVHDEPVRHETIGGVTVGTRTGGTLTWCLQQADSVSAAG